jgi:hypothetical protein
MRRAFNWLRRWRVDIFQDNKKTKEIISSDNLLIVNTPTETYLPGQTGKLYLAYTLLYKLAVHYRFPSIHYKRVSGSESLPDTCIVKET